jgi:fatty acid desaturase
MTRKEILQRLHHKSSRALFESVVSVALFFGLLAVTLAAWVHGCWPVVIIGWLLQAHVGHINLLAFHEASHHTLHPNRRLNELQGIILGSVILTPLSAYRWVHNQHHIYLGTARDTELWPFVVPQAPRWRRLLTAAVELLLGFFYTPVIFLRGVLVARRMPRATVRRLVKEYAICFALWVAVLSAAIRFGVTKEFIVGYLIPAMLAGNLQSLRKFTEHLGLLGHDVPSNTRTVIDSSLLGRLLSASILHIDLHGPHHLHAKIPHFHLPAATPIAYEQELCDPISANIFPSYIAAIRAMLWTLPDPRVGAQWLTNGETVALSANSHTGDSHSPSTAIRTMCFSKEGIGNNRPRIVEAAQAALVSEGNGHGRPVNRTQESVCL